LSDFLEASEIQQGARKVLEKGNLQTGEEVGATLVTLFHQYHDLGSQVLSIRGGEFWWSNKAARPTLSDINLTVKKGEIVGILGRPFFPFFNSHSIHDTPTRCRCWKGRSSEKLLRNPG